MALTTAVTSRNVVGNQQLRVVDIAFDSSYPTGGEALVPSDMGLNRVDAFIPTGGPANAIVYNGSTLLLAYDNAGVEVVNATDLSGLDITAIVLGQ